MTVELDDGSTMDVSPELFFKSGAIKKAERLKHFTEFIIKYLEFEKFEGIVIAPDTPYSFAIMFLDKDTKNLNNRLLQEIHHFIEGVKDETKTDRNGKEN